MIWIKSLTRPIVVIHRSFHEFILNSVAMEILGIEESQFQIPDEDKPFAKWVQKPDFSVRYKWSKNTIAIWDNRSTQHFVVNNFEGERIIQRVTVTGDIVEPFGELNHDAWSNNNKFSAKSRNDLQLIGYLDSQMENH